MRKYLAATLALLLALNAYPARAVTRSISVTLVAGYDLAATNFTYSFFRGPDASNVDPLGDGATPVARVKNGATGTDVTAFTASTNPFQGLVAGDLLIFPNAPTVVNTGASAINTYGMPKRQERVITTATDDNNAIVDRAIILDQASNGYTFSWKKFVTGEEAEDGWFKVADFAGVEFHIVVTDLHADSVDYSIECRHLQANNAPTQVDTGSISSEVLGSNSHTFYLGIPFDQCRVGLKVTNDTGLQSVWAEVTGEKYDDR